MGLDFKAVSAIFRKDMRAYLGNPTGYVFITLFILATGSAAFLQEGFFSRNLADLATLNPVMPLILMFFVPAITMDAWSRERQAGTDELLMTLPIRDGEVVLGKYLGVVGMFTLSLALTSVAQLTVLSVLGEPDKGLMFSTFAGYWFIGLLFAAIGLVGSMLTLNTTVAFILGATGCLSLVVAGSTPWASGLVGVTIFGIVFTLVGYVATGRASLTTVVSGVAGIAIGALMWQSRRFTSSDEEYYQNGEAITDLSSQFQEFFASLSVGDHFESFGEGVMRLGDVSYFLSGVVVLLYFCAFLLGRRHW